MDAYQNESEFLGKHRHGMRGSLYVVLVGIVVVALSVVFVIRQFPRPCREPLTYRIGTVDERFKIDRKTLVQALVRAETIWEKFSQRELFRAETNGEITINFTYDYRQEAIDKLKKLDYSIENTKSSYDSLRERLDALQARYEPLNKALAADFNTYNIRIQAFNNEAESWSTKGGAPKQVYDRLMAEKDALTVLGDSLQARENDVRALADTINSMVVVVNEIATNYNLELVKYNEAGSVLGDEFQEGTYTQKGSDRSITIFEFDSSERLIRVLAHEFGHALGLGHNEDSASIMFRLNQSDVLEPSARDIAGLRALCGLR